MISPIATKQGTGPIRDWINSHDDRWTFWVLYIGGSVILSIFTSLFWVLMMVVLHLILEIFRHKNLGLGRALQHGLWHLKLDISLIVFALVLSLYGDVVFAALGLGQAARAAQAVRGMQMATRFAILERGIRIFLLTVDDIARVMGVTAKILMGKKNTVTAPDLKQDDFARYGDSVQNTAYKATYHSEGEKDGSSGGEKSEDKAGGHHMDFDLCTDARPWARLGGGDIFIVGFGMLCVGLILVSPLFLDQSWAEIIKEIITELSP